MAYTANDSYCAETDVEYYIGNSITASSVPTTTALQDIMAMRAAEIQTALAGVGKVATPPSGGSPISTTTDDGKALERMCRKCNALLAAGDAVWAGEVRDQATSSRAALFWDQGRLALEALVIFAERMVTSSASSFTDELDEDDLLTMDTIET